MPDRMLVGLTLSLTAAERHDRICDRFEAGWKEANPPRIEELLAEVPESERPSLFVALLRVELDRRRETPPNPEEYRDRFPAFADLVDTLFHNPAELPTCAGPVVDTEIEPPVIDGYEVTGMLGRGGMGVVFRARHVGLDRPAAIKMVSAGALSRPEQLVRFHLEARAVAGLSHPNVVALHDFGQVQGMPYFVMELVEGGSLADRLNGAPAAPAWSAGVVSQLARAVQHVHKRDIIHRDLKPANILLTQDDTPKITDFGLAKRIVGDDPRLTRTRSVLGTACYMSPEQARGNAKAVGPACDIYALGGILYECLTGRPPFRADSYELTIVQVLTEDPVRPSDLVFGLPIDLEAICLKCLEKDPAQRYSTAGELADDLDRFRDGQPVYARTPHVLERHAKWARKIGYDLGDLRGATRWFFTYLAHQQNINRTVRLKLSIGAVGTPAHAALKRQAEAMAGLDHPNVIRLYDYGEQFGQPYLVLEYLEGGESLSRRLRAQEPANGMSAEQQGTSGNESVNEGANDSTDETSHAPMPARAAAKLGVMLAIGLQAIHEHGILHCGLQTGDVVLTRDGTPKIGNFAAARRFDGVGDASGLKPEWVLPHYQSPEVVDEDWARLGKYSDIYALGAILYDLLAGAPPFAAPTLAETRDKVRRERPPAPTGAAPDLDAVVLKCLEKDPMRRYRSAGEVALALQLFLKPPQPGSSDSTSGSDRTVVPDGVPAPDPAISYRLRVVVGPARVGDSFEIPRRRIMMGRSKECDVVLPGKHVSRVQCGVIWNEGGWHEILDYGARNPTFVNAERVIGRRQLFPGDQIRFVNYALLFERLPRVAG